MKVHSTLPRLHLALTCWVALPLSAGDGGPTFDFKVRAGLTAGSLREDHGTNQAYGFGIAGRFPLGGSRAFTLELGFDQFPGRDRDAMPTAGPVYYDAQNPVTSYLGTPLYLSTANSIDFRKEQCQGFSLRGSYTDALPNLGAWYWFAGLSLDSYKVSAEMSGTLIPMYDNEGTPSPVPDPGGSGADYYEGWAFVKEKTKLNVGAHVGVGVPLSDNLKFEFTIRNIGTTHFDYKPFTYTGQSPVLLESTHRGFVFELGLAAKI